MNRFEPGDSAVASFSEGMKQSGWTRDLNVWESEGVRVAVDVVDVARLFCSEVNLTMFCEIDLVARHANAIRSFVLETREIKASAHAIKPHGRQPG